MQLRRGLLLGVAAIILIVLTIYYSLSHPGSRILSALFIGGPLLIAALRLAWDRRATYREEILPSVSAHGFEIVSSTPLPWLSTGPFPAVHVFSQPHVSTETLIGRGEFVRYRKVVLKDASATTSTTYALLEFKAFKCARILFNPPLDSLRGLTSAPAK